MRPTALLMALLLAGLAASFAPRASAVDLLAEVQSTLDEDLEPLVDGEVGARRVTFTSHSSKTPAVVRSASFQGAARYPAQ